MLEIKAIFHVDEMIKWELALKNVTNLLNAAGKMNYEVEVLANSEAVKFYAENENYCRLEKLKNKGVSFVACNNALKGYNIDTNSLIKFVEIVPSGVLELVTRQAEGYAYIKP